MTPIQELVGRILQREGGVADVGDGKGVTRYGQTLDWLAQFGLPSPQTPEQAAGNYTKWLSMTGLDKVIDKVMLDDLADIIVDIAVMSDHRKAIKALQQVLGVTPIDGVLGHDTQTKLDFCDRKKTARSVIAWDMEYQGRLITMDPIGRGKFAAGWAARMAGHVRNLA